MRRELAVRGTNAMSPASDAVFGTPDTTLFSSFSPDTHEGKIALFNAINSPAQRLKSMVNRQIKAVDFVCVRVQLSDGFDDFEGELLRDAVRTIIIDDEGTSYSATSSGVFNSVQLIKSVFGTLHFDEPLTVEVQDVSTKRGSTLTLKVVG